MREGAALRAGGGPALSPHPGPDPDPHSTPEPNPKPNPDPNPTLPPTLPKVEDVLIGPVSEVFRRNGIAAQSSDGAGCFSNPSPSPSPKPSSLALA